MGTVCNVDIPIMSTLTMGWTAQSEYVHYRCTHDERPYYGTTHYDSPHSGWS